MLRLATTALVAAALPGLAAAQEGPGFLELITPNRLLQSLAQTGIMALRTQLDLKYGAMTIDVRTGRVTLTDLHLWPLPEWDEEGDCEISADRVTFKSSGLAELERIRVGLLAEGVAVAQACFPPDAGEGFAMLGIDAVEAPRINAEVVYHIPSSAAEIHAHAAVDGVATVDATADFSYVWVDGRDDMEEPDPVMYLRRATLTAENDGLWQALKPMLPPEFTSDNAGAVIEGVLREGLADLNREARDADGDPGQLTETQQEFLASVVAAWPAFLASPETLVAETRIDGDVYLDLAAIEDDPRELFEALRPVVALAPASVTELLPAALLSQAMGAEAAAMPEADRRRVGLALVTGRGAPRNLAAGITLLAPLAEAGDGEAAMAMSAAVEARAPAEAYRWALLAGAAGAEGAAARLDALERELGLAPALRVQAQVAGGAPEIGTLGSIAEIRDRAAARFSGLGMSRSLGHAALWAMLGAAAGDAESAAILAEIDARVAAAGKPGRAAWAEIEARASAAAMEAWLAQDMPDRLAP